MSKFRKKPVVIEAVQYTGHNMTEVLHFINDANVGLPAWIGAGSAQDAPVLIPTLEGNMIASVGDWIIRGVKGEFYPCKPDIFEATYEPVEEGSNE